MRMYGKVRTLKRSSTLQILVRLLKKKEGEWEGKSKS